MTVVALDQGSSSSRALWIAERGRILARAQVPLGTRHPAAGHVEHDARQIWATQKRALEAVLAKARRRPPQSIAIACQRSTIVLWDKQTGEPAAPALSWQDGRAGEIAATLSEMGPSVHEKTGLYLTPYYSAPKIAWLLRNIPGVRKLADEGRLLIGPVGTFLVWKLTRGEVFACDPTLAQRTLLFDLDSLAWDSELLNLFGVPKESLPEIRPSRGDWGECRLGGLDVPIRAVIGDQQAAALGLGALGEGEAVLNYGTGAFLVLQTGSRRARIPGILSSVTCALDGKPSYVAEGTVHAAATSFEWLKTLGLVRDTMEVDRCWKASRQRVWSLPAIGGLGAPRWDYKTRTTFFGLDSQTRKEDLVRGVGEGLAFLLADIAKAIRSAGFPLTSARASGGLSRISNLIQFQADLLGIPVALNPETEVTAFGAAALAGVRRDGPARGRRFEPKLPADDAARLHAQWTEFVEGAKALSERVPG